MEEKDTALDFMKAELPVKTLGAMLAEALQNKEAANNKAEELYNSLMATAAGIQYQEATSRASHYSSVITSLTVAIKARGMMEWNASDKTNKTLAPGVAVKINTEVNIFDADKALAWAKEKLPQAVKTVLDTPMFTKYVKTFGGVPVEIAKTVEEPTITVSSKIENLTATE